MILRRRYALTLLMLMPLAGTAAGDGWPDDPWERARAVNEGELVFLVEPPAARVPEIDNRLKIGPGSLADGWVTLRQCHAGLDPVPDLEVVYRYRAMRGLRVDVAEGIGHARVEGDSIQLEDIGPDARLCISAQVRILEPLGAGRYRLRSGPFHRRFLDGYYPVQLGFRVTWPAERLQLVAVEPAARTGFAVTQGPGRLAIDTLFEGRLTIRLEWVSRPGMPESD